MTKKSIYTSGELPDQILDEFQEVRKLFLELIISLSKKHRPMAIHSGISRAHLDFIKLAAGDNLKKILMKTAEYFLAEAEKIKEDQ
jgi:hypothetical protein